MDSILELKNITKKFPGVLANDQVNFDLKKGEIHALVGENGAGKSTLMNVLFGIYQQEEGEVFYKGQELDIDGPEDAIDLGIGMVHQHFMLVPTLTVAENIILGDEITTGLGHLDIKQATKEVAELSDKYGLDVDPQAKIKDIPVGMEQRVEILKALYREAEVLILDEPTAVLTPQEVKELYKIMDFLAEQGKSIIFITHKLQEVLAVSDRVTVLRDGKSIGTVKTEATSEPELAEMMVGREVLLEVDKKPAEPGELAVEVNNLSAQNNRGVKALNDVSFSIKEGEILGVAGVEGNGQTELVEVLTGLREATTGEFELKGNELLNHSARDIKGSKVAHVPEDRHKHGLVLDYTIEDNLILGYHHQQPFAQGINFNFAELEKHAEELISEYDIRPRDKDALARSLSGGNQQKVIVAREFAMDPEFLIASQPTRGVDIGAIEFIHQQIINQRDEGKAVLLVSAELSEIMSLSDRIAVMYEGEIVDILEVEEATEEKLGLLMAGGQI
ncbi:ABC transporter ATP-binding protein [Halanaerobacter jeridensis]|uniref:Simple sugar transport system ATP-binding protein n=1 Tax=Halanaerobacter jeridensis TaxID=706427 RepID=A0A938XYA1_9FIRM|nr:ABC transporter ATP-binding protein [Halanaerobacter jeridensis]MBM7557897.1 simple sugar transport system ATP-binding protein [Halanaerobacter jeridensis]